MNFPDLPAAEKSKMVCELFGVKPIGFSFKAADGSFYGSYQNEETAISVARHCYEVFDARNLTKVYPPLTTDFLLELAREKGINASIEFGSLSKTFTAVAWRGPTARVNSISPTDALAMALIRFKGGVV